MGTFLEEFHVCVGRGTQVLSEDLTGEYVWPGVFRLHGLIEAGYKYLLMADTSFKLSELQPHKYSTCP